ncbi:MAG: T9SS type A sorting domain-containing protein [Ignavibacteriae bacterium]|nr:T9SS type A sorting domain-containing protein [Ignavibacteriota bacterium]
MEIAKVFKKYNANFCVALNLNDFKTPEYKDSIRTLQEMGHEIMDHTPNHRTNYFPTQFPISEYYLEGTNIPIDGIDHIINNKICLEFDKVDTTLASKTGMCDVYQNQLLNGFTTLPEDEIYIYIPELNTLVQKSSVENNKIYFIDVWGDPIFLPTTWHTKYFILSKNNVHISDKAVNVLANETRKLALEFNLEPPKTWIQPGGDFPQLSKEKLSRTLGKEFNFVAGAAVKKGRQIYNEFDPNDYERFEMQWGDFFDDTWTVEKCKNVIADRIAKHYMQIGHAHFYEIDSLDLYFAKIDSILAWATLNNIPIKTYSEWAEILYDQTPDEFANVFPALNVDLDKNISELDIYGVPDGYSPRYWSGQGQWEVDTVVAGIGKYAYSISTNSRICRVENLAGIEKGKNDFRIQTKGATGDSIEVYFSFGEYSSEINEIYKFPADTEDWVEYSLEQSSNGNKELIIPENVNFISVDIKCSNYKSGVVKISGMYLAKSRTTSVENKNEEIPNYYVLNQNYPNPFNPATKISYSIPENSQVAIKIYNILGSEIATLVNAKQNSGNYEIAFNASNLASGVYFYTLSTDKFSQTKKMILLR